MTRNGERISSYPVRHSIKTGISYSDDPRVPLGLVPEYEEREAAILSGYTWQEWRVLDSRDRAAGVAFLRMRNLISLHSNDASQREQERKRGRKGKRR